MTNGDYIRSMTDEELARYFDEMSGVGCSFCLFGEDVENCVQQHCLDGIVEWLKQERSEI